MDNDALNVEEHRQRALTKLRVELNKDVARAGAIAAKCGLWELLRLTYLLRVSRMLSAHPRLQGKFTAAQIAEFHLYDEAAKYAIGLVAKHGSWIGEEDLRSSFARFDNRLVDDLMRFARHINAKFESERLLHIANVTVMGERDQDAKLDLDLEKLEPKRAFYLHYGLRLERDTSRGKQRFKPVPELVAQVRQDVAGLEDQFAEMFGLPLDRYCTGLLELKAAFEARYKTALEQVDPQDTGDINFDLKAVFLRLAVAMFFTDSELDAAVNADFAAYLRSHPFESTNAQGSELRFHYLARRPFLVGRGFVVLSPDLCFDSVLSNIRFTLLEGSESKHAYKDAASTKFLDEIAEIAKPYGYTEVARGVNLTPRKGKGLGDIDLVLHSEATSHTLLIEGKNHALPLAVYFLSPEDIDSHVARSRDWEKKVKARIQHIKSDSSSYDITDDWDYLVVSRMPEPLSHHTDVLVLCLDEFQQWISWAPRELRFEEFYQRAYQPNQPTMTMSEMTALMEKDYSLLRAVETS